MFVRSAMLRKMFGPIFLLFLAGAAGCSREQPLGNVLRGNMNAEPQTLNPICYKDVYAEIINLYIFETLIERDHDTLGWKGLLAERWEVSPDGLTFTFHIKPQARFSDGVPLTADNVVFTFGLIKNKEIDCSNVRPYYEDCERCEKVDDHTVRFVWKKPYFKSLESSGTMFILPKHIYTFKSAKEFNDINDYLIGSGRYKFVRWKTGQGIELERNEDYWGERPAIDRIEYRFILEDQASVQAFLGGELDFLAVSPSGG